MGDIGEPCGILFSTGLDSEVQPSRHIAASLLDKNELTHLTIGSGIRFLRMMVVNLLWLT